MEILSHSGTADFLVSLEMHTPFCQPELDSFRCPKEASSASEMDLRLEKHEVVFTLIVYFPMLAVRKHESQSCGEDSGVPQL